MTAQFTQPTTTASANGGTGRDAANNNRAAINEKSSALAKVGGGRYRKRSSKRYRKRSNKQSGKRSTKRYRKRSHKQSGKRSGKRKIYGGGTEAPLVEGRSGATANKLAIAQMAGAENSKYDAKV